MSTVTLPDETPDTYPKVWSGVYEGTVQQAIQDTQDTKNGTKNVLDVKIQITHADDPDNEESVGLPVYDRIWTDFSGPTDRNAVKLKRLGLSAELDESQMAGGFDPSLLQGAVVKFRVNRRTYKAQDGREKETVDVKDYITD